MKLSAGAWELRLAPELGGAITSLRRRGRDILRPAPEGATEPFLLASFVMAPYANRITEGRFEAGGEQYALAPNHEGQDHPLHGVSWLRPWTVENADAVSATLVHRYAGDAAWPWAYRAEQHITLDAGGLSIIVTLTNEAEQAMPASLGFHPYFVAGGDTALHFDADQVWLCDEQCLPTTLAAADAFGNWASGGLVQRAPFIDNSYVGWKGRARLSHPDGDLLVIGDNTPVLHLYTPPGEAFFCLEPATSMPDAINRSKPIVLRSGQQHRIGMAIRTA